MKPVDVAIGTPYGKRGSYWSCNEDSNGNGIHTGVDYPAGAGTKIVAARPGTVHYCNHGSAFGNHQLEITPGDGTRDFYAHMRSRAVADGAKVDVGQKIGEIGSEGNVTGPHLHFERHKVATGGWSCSVVVNPQPSIDYKASGSGGSGGEDDDMPEYVSVSRGADLKLGGDDWQVIVWDHISAGDNVADEDSPGINIGGKKYTAVITANVEVPGGNAKSDSTIRTRTIEGDFNGKGGDWQVLEENAATEHPVTTGGTYLSDARVGNVGKERRLRVQFTGPKGAIVKQVGLTLLYW